MRKRVLALIYTVLLFCFLTACAGQKQGEEAGKAEQNTAAGNIENDSTAEAEPVSTGTDSTGTEGDAVEAEPKSTPTGRNSTPAEEKLSLQMLLTMAEKQDFEQHQQDFLLYKNGKREEGKEGEEGRFTISFSFPYEGDRFDLVYIPKSAADNSMERLELSRKSNDACLPLYVDEGGNITMCTEQELENFLGHAYHIKDDIIFKLPKGMKLGRYTERNGEHIGDGACALKGKDYILNEGAGSEAEKHLDAGEIGRFQTKYVLEWKGEQIEKVHNESGNSEAKIVQHLDNCAVPAVLIEDIGNGYTTAEWEKLQEKGIDTQNLKQNYQKWTVLMAQPEDEMGYYVSLNSEAYNKQDVIDIAKTVRYVG